MKKLALVLLCALMIFGCMTACGDKTDTVNSSDLSNTTNGAYIGKFYSVTAKVMGTEATLEIFEDGTFTMITTEGEDSSTITGTYFELAGNEITLIPEKQVLIKDGETTETDMSEAGSIVGALEGDDMILGKDTEAEAVYSREK